MSSHTPSPLTSHRSGPLRGSVTVPGDKSISHRSVMLGGLAAGRTTVRGLLEGEDVLCTMAALRALGAKIEKSGESWLIDGVDGQLQQTAQILDMGNSGTAARLLIGLLSAYPFATSFTGDASLQKRPMARVIDPLRQIGAHFQSAEGHRLPLTVTGTAQARAITYRLPVASAQVKSAVLLAGLNIAGATTVIENAPTRDHSERMLRHFGAHVDIYKTDDGAEAITLTGRPKLRGCDIIVPADISSAAFPMVAALLRPNSEESGSEITLPHVGLNPRRAGLIESLREMGAQIEIVNQRESCGEPVADLTVRSSGILRGVDVPAERAPSMIDEYPILAMACACATGTSRLRGLGELRVKESDRLALVAEGLAACGVEVRIEGDDLIIVGTGGSGGAAPRGGASVATALDHRIAMSFLVLGMASAQPITVDDGSMIATSFPNFTGLMNKLGAKISAS